MSKSALKHLRADPVLARIIKGVGPCRFAKVPAPSHFAALCRDIIYQQLSGKAAEAIHIRFKALHGETHPSPARLLKTPEEKLRGAGLSRGKVAFLRDLAAKSVSGELPLDTLHELPDEELIATVTKVKGIGPWTAQMFLIFHLGRPDVLPGLDLGIRKAVQRGWKLRQLPSAEKVLKLGKNWSPHATIATWYLWRSLEVKEKSPNRPEKMRNA
jgi:3-methyladenine DNA glycosylase/8-oxoguanine DNA glycosylase